MTRARSSSPQTIDRRFLARWPLPPPEEAADKDGRGCALVVAGSRPMPGGAILAATAALRAGAGKVQLAVPRSIAMSVACDIVESYVHALPESASGALSERGLAELRRAAATASAVLIGPALVDGPKLDAIVLALLRSLEAEQLAILDGAALTALASHLDVIARLRCSVCITPHSGEMATLCDIDKRAVESGPLEHAVAMAKRLRATVVLKGKKTFVTDGVTSLANERGNVGLAISGSGDTLAGVLAGLAARGAKPLRAAAWAVHLHARAGEVLAKKVGPIGYLPREMLAQIPRLMAPVGRRR